MYVIGTAGHVDHGKSTLVEALTGIDPDRLREEKERGMTIDLGFAWLQLPNGNEVSIVDVPGHEKFVNNMLAGVGGVDLALLVVAADESVMPQTREHLAILNLLQINRGLVAVTKSDLVDGDWLDLVIADVEEMLKGTSLENAPIIPVSSLTQDGLPELVSTIEALLEATSPEKNVGRPRLPIDRSFTIAGFGTVVTGTLIDGNLSIGQEVELVVSGTTTRIRGLQTHRHRLEQASPGTRVAANLAGVSNEAIARGEVLTTPRWLKPTTAMDVRLNVISEAPHPIKHNMFVTVHTGSSEVIGRVRLLDSRLATPGTSTWAQLKLRTPLAAVKGDYFVIRSNQTTLGGGNIVDSNARRHRRSYQPILDRLATMETGSEREILVKTIEMSEPAEFEALVTKANLARSTARFELESMSSDGTIVTLGRQPTGPGTLIYTLAGWDSVANKTRRSLEKYHGQFHLRKGAPKEELRNRLGMTPQIFSNVLERLHEDGVVVEEGTAVRLPQHQPHLTEVQRKEAQLYIRLLESKPYTPPTDVPIDPEILSLLDETGDVVKVSETVVFAASAYRAMVDKISTFLRERDEITVADVRDMFGASRKYSLALMDYLDHQHITRRVGDVRVLR